MSLPENITVVRSLASYLASEISDFSDILEDFPEPNRELNLPALSIQTTGEPELINISPYLVSSSSIAGDSVNVSAIYGIGQYNMSLQADIWAEYKEDRGNLYQLVKNALNKDFIDNHGPLGLSLALTDYYSAIARYDHVGYNYVSTEESSQRSEWRVSMKLLVTFGAFIEKTVPAMVEASITHNIDEGEIDAVDSNDETKEVF